MMKIKQQYIKLYKQVENYSIVSFDIFDTLLLRPFAHPEHLLDLVELELLQTIGTQAKNYKKRRIMAAKQCKEALTNSHNQEVSLAEIIGFIDGFDDTQKAQALQVELEMEAKHLKANKTLVMMLKDFRQKGKKIIYSSDTHFDAEFIRNILIKENIWEEGDVLYTSLDLKKNKANNGDLFLEILNRENINHDMLIHMGDNYRADYKMPVKHKISAYWLKNPISQDGSKDYSFFLLTQDKRGSNQTHNLSLATSLTLGLDNIYRSLQHKGLLYDIGYHILAPLYLKIIFEIKHVQEQQQNEIILYLARDGYVLSKIHDVFFDDNVKHRYFPASRRLLCLPSANYDEFKSIILGGSRNRSIQSYLNGFSAPKVLIHALKQRFVDFKKTLSKKEFYILRDIFEKHWPDIQKELNKEQENLLNFLEQELQAYNKIMIFDLGWKGSLLKKLQEIIPHKQWSGFYFATLKGAYEQLNISSFALDRGKPEYRNQLYFQNQELLELFFCEGEESFQKIIYDEKIHKYIAKRSHYSGPKEQNIHQVQHLLQEGIFDFINDFKKQFSEKQCQYLIKKIDPLMYLDHFIKAPKKIEARIFRNIYHYSITGSEYKQPFVSSKGLKGYRKSLWKPGSLSQQYLILRCVTHLYEWQKKYMKRK